jgi:hypothetical protein
VTDKTGIGTKETKTKYQEQKLQNAKLPIIVASKQAIARQSQRRESKETYR